MSKTQDKQGVVMGSSLEVEDRLDDLEERVALLERHRDNPLLLVHIEDNGEETWKRIPQDLEVATREEVRQAVRDSK